jgi:hypothetical protein
MTLAVAVSAGSIISGASSFTISGLLELSGAAAVYATLGADQGPETAILPDRRENHR